MPESENLPEGRIKPYAAERLEQKGLHHYAVRHEDSPFATIRILEPLNILSTAQERKALHLKMFKFPDPPEPENDEDVVGRNRNQRYENEVSMEHIRFIMHLFPVVATHVLNAEKESEPKPQTKWRVETPRFDHSILRVSRSAGGVDLIDGVVRYPFADIIPANPENRTIIEAKLPRILHGMNILEENLFQTWLKSGGPQRGTVRHYTPEFGLAKS